MRAKWIIIAVTGMLAMSSGVASAAQGDSASGAGTFDDWAHCAFDSTTTFEFAAVGTGAVQAATGTFSFVCSSPEQAFSGVVSCLEVDGSSASVGGTITASNAGNVPVGTALSFNVYDGGPAGAGDGVGVLITQATCRWETGYAPLTGGDILVQDGAPPPPQCAGELDNDGDGAVDFPADAGCASAEDDTEAPNPPPPAARPTSKEDCMKGGYAQYGFKNQGECIKAVSSKGGGDHEGGWHYSAGTWSTTS